MDEVRSIYVYYHHQLVGSLSERADHRISFQYDDTWLHQGFSISPFSLPLKEGAFIPDDRFTFQGLFGVFADNLPDGWGRLLTDRLLQVRDIDLNSYSSFERLGLLNDLHMGGLDYKLQDSSNDVFNGLTLDEIACACTSLYQNDECSVLNELYRCGGGCGGAQPKVNWQLDNQLWIVKFPPSFKQKTIGLMEYEYMACAKYCGINVTEFCLLQSNWCDGYFATKRFDRDNGNKRHMISLSALLETSHRIPNLDYLNIFNVVKLLNNERSDIEEMYRRMCFNVFAHNRDDHSKNFSFLYDEQRHRYVLSPAYDLTYSNSIGGEHATTIDGVGDSPNLKHLLNVAKKVGLDYVWAKTVALDIDHKVEEQLNRWLHQ